MSKKSTYKSWSEFRHHLSGNNLSITEISVLYQKYKSDEIPEDKLDDIDVMISYLSKSEPKKIPKNKTNTKNLEKYDLLKKKLMTKTLNDDFINALGTYGNETDHNEAQFFIIIFNENKTQIVDEIIKDMIIADKAIKKGLDWKNDQFGDLIYVLANKLSYLEEFNLAYGYYIQLAKTTNQITTNQITGDPDAMFRMYLLLSTFLDNDKLLKWRKEHFQDAAWIGIRWLIAGYQEGSGVMSVNMLNEMTNEELIDWLEIYEDKLSESNEREISLEEKILELEKENNKLKEQIVDLTFRPGGPGFEKAKSRQIDRFNIKK